MNANAIVLENEQGLLAGADGARAMGLCSTPAALNERVALVFIRCSVTAELMQWASICDDAPIAPRSQLRHVVKASVREKLIGHLLSRMLHEAHFPFQHDLKQAEK